MNIIAKTIILLRQEMVEWFEAHGSPSSWVDIMYGEGAEEKFRMNEPTRYGFDWREACAEDVAKHYIFVKCSVCGNISEYASSCYCADGEDETVEHDELIRYLTDDEVMGIDEGAMNILEEQGYPIFVAHFGLDEIIKKADEVINDFDDIFDADDALVWLMKASHVKHYGGYHLETVTEWNEEDVIRLCDDGPQEFFGRDVVEDFIDTFNLTAVKYGNTETVESEEEEDFVVVPF